LDGRRLCLERGCGLEVVVVEDDGLAWFVDGVIYVNARWLTNHPPDIREVVEEISRCVLHELLEHVIGLGHEYAVIGESMVYGSPVYRRK